MDVLFMSFIHIGVYFMFLPYTHQAAMAQTPVPFSLSSGNVITLHPLTIGASQEFLTWLQYKYIMQFSSLCVTVPIELQSEFQNTINTSMANFDIKSGIGQEYFLQNEEALLHYIEFLTRHDPQWPVDRIKSNILPYGIEPNAVQLVLDLSSAVTRPIPPPPPMPNIEQKHRDYTPEESVVRIYRSLGEKYHWTFDQCLALTDYQIYWYLYMLPEEREQIEELEAMTKSCKNEYQPASAPTGPNFIHFNTAEEYNMWLASKKQQETP